MQTTNTARALVPAASCVIRRGRRDLPTPTAGAWRRRILAAFAIACMALPLGLAAAGNLAGIN
jgi:hypothetical protein